MRDRTGVRLVDGTALTPQQRVHLRLLLEEQWRGQLSHLTELSLELHPADGDDSVDHDAQHAMVTALAAAHQAMAETEAALTRLEQGRLGRCEGCAHTIPYEWLESRPQERFCVRCQPTPDP